MTAKQNAELRVLDAEPPGQGVVERLEEALEKARAGEISSIALAVVYRDGSVSGSWSDAPNRMLLLGSLSRLAYRVNLDGDQ